MMVANYGAILAIICLSTSIDFAPKPLPLCKNGGQRIYSDGYSFCQCVQSYQTGPLCELTRININSENGIIAKPSVPLSLPIRLSFELVNRDYYGNGKLITLANMTTGCIFGITLQRGYICIDAYGQLIRTKLAPVSDNKWHRVDLIMSNDTSQVFVNIILDKCGYGKKNCAQQITFQQIIDSSTLNGSMQIGGISATGEYLRELCIENIIFNSELIDFTEPIHNNSDAKGCPACEKACETENNTPKCGPFGICRNTWTAVDQYTCRCKTGYQPSVPLIGTGSWRNVCNQKSLEWQTIANSVNLQISDENIADFWMSIRTRKTDFIALSLDSNYLQILIINGFPVLRFLNSELKINTINVSNGYWHTFHIGLSPSVRDYPFRLLQFSVDNLWDTFHKYALVSDPLFRQKINLSMVIGANHSCITDVRIGFPILQQFEGQHFLFGDINAYNKSELQPGCYSSDLCKETKPCNEDEICIPEWQSHQCICHERYSFRPTAAGIRCVLSSCQPNPCKNEAVCVPINSSITLGNVTVAIDCQCLPGWEGLFCENAIIIKSSFVMWWLIPIFIALVITVIWAFFCCIWLWKNNQNKVDRQSFKKHLNLTEGFSDIGMFKAGEVDYRGSIDLGVFRSKNSPPGSKIPTEPIKRTPPKKRGPYSPIIFPWENTDAFCDRTPVLEQPLEYAFEGFDTTPQPTYCSPRNFI